MHPWRAQPRFTHPLSPTLNPIIYALHNTAIRKLIMNKIRNRKLKNRSSSTYKETNTKDFVQSMNPVKPFRKKTSQVLNVIKMRATSTGSKNNSSSTLTIPNLGELTSDSDPSVTERGRETMTNHNRIPPTVSEESEKRSEDFASTSL